MWELVPQHSKQSKNASTTLDDTKGGVYEALALAATAAAAESTVGGDSTSVEEVDVPFGVWLKKKAELVGWASKKTLSTGNQFCNGGGIGGTHTRISRHSLKSVTCLSSTSVRTSIYTDVRTRSNAMASSFQHYRPSFGILSWTLPMLNSSTLATATAAVRAPNGKAKSSCAA